MGVVGYGDSRKMYVSKHTYLLLGNLAFLSAARFHGLNSFLSSALGRGVSNAEFVSSSARSGMFFDEGVVAAGPAPEPEPGACVEAHLRIEAN